MAYLLNRILTSSSSVLLLLLCWHVLPSHVMAAPSADWPQDRSLEQLEKDREHYFDVLEALMQKLQEVKRKRTRPDGGFFSRHEAMNDYLQSAYANELAMDPYGPGKKK